MDSSGDLTQDFKTYIKGLKTLNLTEEQLHKTLYGHGAKLLGLNKEE